MGVLRRLAEQRIVEAIERGEFDELPGAGRALDLGGDAYVPSELRAIYRVLKNSGYLPPELTLGNEIRAARQRVASLSAGDPHAGLRVKLESARGRPLSPALEAAYGERLLERLGGRRGGEQTGD